VVICVVEFVVGLWRVVVSLWWRRIRIMRGILVAILLLMPAAGWGQWQILDGPTTADLRGVDNVGKGVVWVSGTHGTVLRSIDDGASWRTCAVPQGAEGLDFRGIQGFDANVAIVMSSGVGDASRLYKTTDGCQSWKLVFVNPDKDGFWDSISAHIVGPLDAQTCSSSTPTITGAIFGDPAIHISNSFDKVHIPSFYLATFTIGSSCSKDVLNPSATAIFSGPGEAAFAASNSVLYQAGPNVFWFATARELIQYEKGTSSPHHYDLEGVCGIDVPFRRATPSQGVFGFAVRAESIERPKAMNVFAGPRCLKADIVAVGGDYQASNDRSATAAFTAGGKKFQLAKTMPNGYRSAVAYDADGKTWITVGPNGTDVSADDGRN
jgi:hypothetical protein